MRSNHFYSAILGLSLCLLLSFDVFSTPGDIDPAFGIGGRALYPVGKSSLDTGRAAALQPDGKIIVACQSISDGQFTTDPGGTIVMRLNSDGSFDNTFGVGGKIIRRLRVVVQVSSVVIQADGKILVGGNAVVDSGPITGLMRQFLIFRLLPNGAPDLTFGVAGTVIDHILDGQFSRVTSIAVQTDGKIVAAGFTGATAPDAIAVARYNPDGTPDNSFDSDHKLFINVNATGNRANAVAIQPDGKIVIAGSLLETSGSVTDFLLVRLNSDGSFDSGFDGDGTLTTKFTTTNSSIAAVGLQSDGKIVAAGNSSVGATRNIAVSRYNTDGSLDSAFGNDGMLTTDIGDDLVTSLAIQSDGKVLVASETSLGTESVFDYAAVRYNTDGSLDDTFDTDGIVVVPVAAPTDRPAAVLVQPDGHIVMAGWSTDALTFSDVSLIRLVGDGSLDSTFNGNGKLVLNLANAADRIYDTVVQPDGKIVAVGYAFGGGFTQPAVARFNSNGSIDSSFASQGSLVLLEDSQFEDRSASRVALQSDGKIVFVVYTYGAASPYTIVRLNPNGSLDQNFGNAGVVTVAVGTNDTVAGLAIQASGKIVVAGTSGNDTGGGPSLIQLNADGSLDLSFGVGGKVLTTDATVSGNVYAMCLDPAGRIVVAGSNSTSDSNTFFTSRYNSDGFLDTTFGGTGAVYTAIGNGMFDSANIVSAQQDGKVLVAGENNESYAVFRYLSDGTLDTSFDGDGKVIIPNEGTTRFWFGDLVIQQNGKLVLAGGKFTPLGNNVDGSQTALFRFNPNGSVDNSFGINGRTIASLGDYDSYYYSASLLPNGNIVAGGFSSNGFNDDFTLVRYVGDPILVRRAPFDFDGDGKTDLSVFRPQGPSGAEWWYRRSSNGTVLGQQFGISTDRPVAADFTGDGKTDVAVWRPSSGQWFIIRSEDGSFYAFPFGTNGDIPVPADYDGDGKADPAVFRPSTGQWFIQKTTGGTDFIPFGKSSDVPVTGDFDGDGKADIAIFRPSGASPGAAEWWIRRSSGAGVLAFQFGISTDKAVPGDYTGDGKTDVAIYRPGSPATWYVLRSEDFSFFSFPFGTMGDLPVPGNYDGDAKWDAGVFRPSNKTWFVNQTSGGTLIIPFGVSTDVPVPSTQVGN